MKWCKLGELIEPCDERNVEGKYGVEAVRGISIEKKVISTKANMEGVSLAPYKLFKPNEFCFVTITSRNGGKISLACNESEETYIVSSSYEVFRIASDQLLPGYLNLLFHRSEFDRYARFNSWGSAREAFSMADMRRVEIPLPTLAEQREAVAAWQGLRKLKTENEQLAEPLMALCRSAIEGMKHAWPMVEIGPMIERKDERNVDKKVAIVKSVSVTKEFKDTGAKVDKTQLQSYKIVRPDELSFVQTTGNEKCLCIAVNHFGEPIVVTSVNEVFAVDATKLLPDYLYLWFARKEADRYARYHSWGSAREIFAFADMRRVKVPLPPVEVQQSIVDIYRAAAAAKRIAAEADELSRKICPALIQKVVAGERPDGAGLSATLTEGRAGRGRG